jgi:ABC-type Fe3+-siderophore transport system permease subunit
VRWFVGILVALFACLAIYVGSAVVSLGGLVKAVRAQDAAEVLARTDTARLRRSLVDQIVQSYLQEIGRDRPVKPLERLAANTYGASIADAMIAKMLTPESLTAILTRGSIAVGDAEATCRVSRRSIQLGSLRRSGAYLRPNL